MVVEELHGKIDNISIWDRSLNQLEIQQNMNCPL